MKIFHNTRHAEHAGRQEMFRGRMVDCHEVPDRLRFVLDELQRRPVGQLLTPGANLNVNAAMARVHAPDYLAWAAPLFAMVGDRFPIRSLMLITVKSVQPIVAPSYWMYPDETTERKQVQAAMAVYGVRKSEQ